LVGIYANEKAAVRVADAHLLRISQEKKAADFKVEVVESKIQARYNQKSKDVWNLKPKPSK
jgi:hypothetical protein